MPWPSHCPTRGSCPTRSSNRSDCVPFAAASWATLRSRWRNCLASPGRPSRGGGPPTLIMAWKLSQATAPAARSAPVVPSTTGKRHGCGRSSTKKARRGGDRLPVVDPRAVAELIRKEYGIDMPMRTVGEYLERWGYTAKVPRRHAKDQDPEEVRHWLEITYPAIEARAAREDADPLVRRDRRGGRPATATGLRPRRAAGEDRGARSPHPHQPDLDD